MNRVGSWASSRPVRFALLLLAVYFTLLSIPVIFSSGAFGGDASKSPNVIDLGQLPFELFLAISIVAVIWFVGWSKKARLTSAPDWSGIWAPIIYALYALSILVPGLMVASETGVDLGEAFAAIPWAQFVLFMLLIGIFEEGLFRGVVLHGFEEKIGPLAAVLVSSALFGSMHFVNWITGQALASTIDQVIHAAMTGFLYAAIALRMNSIWFGIALHALFDGVVDFNGQLLAAAAAAASASDAMVTPVPALEPASPETSLLGGLFSFLLKNVEVVFGLVILWSWWHRRNRHRVPSS